MQYTANGKCKSFNLERGIHVRKQHMFSSIHKIRKIIYLSLSQNTFEIEHWNVSEVMFDCITLPSKF